MWLQILWDENNHRLLRSQGELLAHIEKISIEWVLCRTLVFVKFARYNYIVGKNSLQNNCKGVDSINIAIMTCENYTCNNANAVEREQERKLTVKNEERVNYDISKSCKNEFLNTIAKLTNTRVSEPM